MGECYPYKALSHLHDAEIRAIRAREISGQVNHFKSICLENAVFSYAPNGWSKSSNIFSLDNFLQQIACVISPEDAPHIRSYEVSDLKELYQYYLGGEIKRELNKRISESCEIFPDFLLSTALKEPELIIAWRQSQGIDGSSFLSPKLLISCACNLSLHPESFQERYRTISRLSSAETRPKFVVRQALRIVEGIINQTKFSPEALVQQTDSKSAWSRAFPIRPNYESYHSKRMYPIWVSAAKDSGIASALWDCVVLAREIKRIRK